MGEPLEAIAEELADHFERGDEPVRAMPHFHRAAEKALRRGANEEASATCNGRCDLVEDSSIRRNAIASRLRCKWREARH